MGASVRSGGAISSGSHRPLLKLSPVVDSRNACMMLHFAVGVLLACMVPSLFWRLNAKFSQLSCEPEFAIPRSQAGCGQRGTHRQRNSRTFHPIAVGDKGSRASSTGTELPHYVFGRVWRSTFSDAGSRSARPAGPHVEILYMVSFASFLKSWSRFLCRCCPFTTDIMRKLVFTLSSREYKQIRGCPLQKGAMSVTAGCPHSSLKMSHVKEGRKRETWKKKKERFKPNVLRSRWRFLQWSIETCAPLCSQTGRSYQNSLLSS